MTASFYPSLRGLSAWTAILGLMGAFVACSRAVAFEPAPQRPADNPCASPPAVDETGASAAVAVLVKPPRWKKEQISTPLIMTVSTGRPRGLASKHTMIAALSIALLSMVVRCLWVFGQSMTNCLTFFWGSNPEDMQGEAAAEVGHPPPSPALQVQQEVQQQERVTSSLGEHSMPEEDEEDEEDEELQNLIWTDLESLTPESLSGSDSQERELPEETDRIPRRQRSFLGLALSHDLVFESDAPHPYAPPSSLLDSSVWPSGDVSPPAYRVPQPGDHAEQRKYLGKTEDLLPNERRGPFIQSVQREASDEESSGLLRSPMAAAAAEWDAGAAAQKGWGSRYRGSPWTSIGAPGQLAVPVGGWGRQVQPFYGVPQGEPYSHTTLSPPSPPPHSPFDFGFFRSVTQSLSGDSGGDDADSTTS
ncbi:hypothetical protein Emag_005189 [Eimeria magna]